jgi:hypothetical protein
MKGGALGLRLFFYGVKHVRQLGDESSLSNLMEAIREQFLSGDLQAAACWMKRSGHIVKASNSCALKKSAPRRVA